LLVLDRGDAPDAVVADCLARMPGASLEVVALHVLPEWTQRSLEIRTRADLQQAAARLTSERCRIVGDVRRGEPVDQILAAAAHHGAELIVVSASRRGVIPRGLSQSELVGILRQSPVPVFMLESAERS
jgi:nucleotide-binding universal stress UspA family protein